MPVTMLTDNFNRSFSYLRLSITDVCNFKCNYCLPDGYECDTSRDFLSIDEITNLVTAFANLGIEKVRITGGEPALRKDLPAIIKKVKSITGIKSVALTTNGFNLKEKVKDWAEAGLDQLNVSIDSLDPSQFKLITGSTKHQEILDGLTLAQTLNFKQIKLNTVLLKQNNLKEFSQFVQWVKDKPISLRFIELMRTNDNLEFYSQQHVRGEDLKTQLEQQGWLPVIKSKTAGPALEYTHSNYEGRIGFILPYSKDFCASCNRLRVSATGNLHQCLFSETGSNFRHLLQSPNQLNELESWLKTHTLFKGETHLLHQDLSGGTKHLAMLGG